MSWLEVKQWLEASSGLHMDALHVHAGIMCQLAAALVLRKSLRSIWPWLVVFAAVAANEYYDLYYDVWPNRDDQWGESAKDAWNTLLLPTLLTLAARYAPWLLTGKVAAETSGTD